MLKQLKTYLEYGNRFCGVEHTVRSSDNIIYATVLKKSKNTLDKENVFEEQSIEKICTKLSKKQAIHLIINNEQVLTKHIESKQNELAKLVYNAFPNINLDEFLYEVITNGNNHFIAICRKTYVEELITKYKENNCFVFNLSLGNNIVSTILPFFSHNSIISSNANILIENAFIKSIEKHEVENSIDYNINGLQINNNQLLSFSAALHGVLQKFNPQTNFEVLKQTLKKDFTQNRFYSQFLKFGLIFILSLLLFNFIFFNHYFNEVNTLQQTSQINQTTKQKILELNERVTKSQKTVEDMLKSSSSKSSFYVSSIIKGLPSTVLLTELNYQPVLKRIKAEQPINTDNNTIFISGESNSSDQFSKWIVNLESTDWIKKVEIQNYEDESKSLSNFSLKLTIANDNKNQK